MKLFHATGEEGFLGIMSSRCIKPFGSERVVYLADSHYNAIKFAAMKIPMNETIYVIEVELPDSKVFETFDHSYNFFRCKSYGFKGVINSELWNRCTKYPAPRGGA